MCILIFLLYVCMYVYCTYVYTYICIYPSIQLHYISSAVSLYFPYDFCLYPGMTAVASYSLRYIPFVLMIIISVIFFTAHR